MKHQSKSPIRRTPVSPAKNNNYAEKSILLKEIEYWKFKYTELEAFCQNKQSYLKLESELELWKSKYQQLSIRARVAKGSELIIKEYQSRIAALSKSDAIPQFQNCDCTQTKDLNEQVNHLQEQIKILKNQVDELVHQNTLLKQANESNQENETINELKKELITLQNDQNKIHDYYQNQLKEKDFQLEQEKIKLQMMKTDSMKSITSQDKIINDLTDLQERFNILQQQSQLELQQKDEYYQNIVSQLKLQIQNQIQSGEMRLSTLYSLLKEPNKQQIHDKIEYSSFGKNEYSEYKIENRPLQKWSFHQQDSRDTLENFKQNIFQQ